MSRSGHLEVLEKGLAESLLIEREHKSGEKPLAEGEEKLLLAALKAKATAVSMTAAAAQTKELKENMTRMNSIFPETKKFLEAKGLSSVSELDEAGREELVQHLRGCIHREGDCKVRWIEVPTD